MKKTVLFCALLGLAACSDSKDDAFSSAQVQKKSESLETSSDLLNKGFFEIGASEVPEKIRKAGKSVFILKTIAASDERVLKVVDVSKGQGQDLKQKIKNLDSDSFDETDKIVLEKQIESCEERKEVEDQKNCIVSFEIAKSTAFLAVNGKTLWTNAHSLKRYMNYIEKNGNISKKDQLQNKQRVAAFIFDQNNQLIFNPYKNIAKIDTVPVESNVAKSRGEYFAEDSDYISLLLDKSIGVPLKIAKQNVTESNSVYVVGYPTCTGCDSSSFASVDKIDFESRSPNKNSDGKGLKVTMGTVLSRQSAQTFFQMTDESMNRWNVSEMLFYTADSQYGNSGGPILNESAEVVGIHAGGKSKKSSGKFERVSRGVVPPFVR